MDTILTYAISLLYTLIVIFTIPVIVFCFVANSPERIIEINNKKFIHKFVLINGIISAAVFILVSVITDSKQPTFGPLMLWSALLDYLFPQILEDRYFTITNKPFPSDKNNKPEKKSATVTKSENFFNDGFEEILPYSETSTQSKNKNKIKIKKNLKKSVGNIKSNLKNNLHFSFKAKNIIIIILSVSLTCSCIGLFAQNCAIEQISSQIDELNKEKNMLTNKVESLNKTIDNKDKQLETLAASINDMSEKLEFYEEYAVCVNDYDIFFHKYGCSKLDTSYFYIYNKEAAAQKGYYSCPYCK